MKFGFLLSFIQIYIEGFKHLQVIFGKNSLKFMLYCL
jgi:hypothetical protein